MLCEDKVMLLENANEALQKQLRWAEEVEMRLKVEVACVRAVVDSRSVIELGVREFYILNPKPKMKDFHSARIKSFIFDHVLNDPGNKAPKKTFTGLLKTRPEEIRSQLTTAGFKGSSASWDPSVLRDEFDHLHTKLSSMVHNSDTVSTLPFSGWCLGGPSDSAAAQIILAVTVLEATYPFMQRQYNFPLKLLILDRRYEHVLTWQRNCADTGFEIVQAEQPDDAPTPSPSPGPALASSSAPSPPPSPVVGQLDEQGLGLDEALEAAGATAAAPAAALLNAAFEEMGAELVDGLKWALD
jgi:hypothetical protein